MGKIITGIVVALVVILGVLASVFYFNLDKVIIAAVEEYGSEVTQAEVTLNEVDLDITSGKGALRGLFVGNPKGFEEPSAFELGEISLSINMSDTNEKLIHINEIQIIAPQITYELNNTTNNLDALKKNIDAFMKKEGLDGKSEKGGSGQDEDGPKIIIDKLVIKNGKVTVKAPITLNKKIEGNLPTIQITDIGKKQGGASPEEVAAQILNKVTASAMSVVTDLGIGKTLESLTGGAGDAVKAIGGSAAGAASGAGKAVEGATGAIKGLLK
ncbi:MAG: hypothetical protein V7750_04435 [Sneathiella sp.]